MARAIYKQSKSDIRESLCKDYQTVLTEECAGKTTIHHNIVIESQDAESIPRPLKPDTDQVDDENLREPPKKQRSFISIERHVQKFLRNGQYSRAFEFINREIERQPEHTRLLMIKARVLLKSGNPKEAQLVMALACQRGFKKACQVLDKRTR